MFGRETFLRRQKLNDLDFDRCARRPLTFLNRIVICLNKRKSKPGSSSFTCARKRRKLRTFLLFCRFFPRLAAYLRAGKNAECHINENRPSCIVRCHVSSKKYVTACQAVSLNHRVCDLLVSTSSIHCLPARSEFFITRLKIARNFQDRKQ